MPVEYKEIKCDTVLGDVGILPTRLWTRHCFDPYTNCEFNCVYCNTGISQPDVFQNNNPTVCVATNAPQVLENELKQVKHRGVLNMGVATDIYQPAEKKYQITRRILQILRDYKCPFALGTKSDLILRDLDIIKEASKKTWCCTSLSIATLDEQIAQQLEPNASPPKDRLNAVKRLSDAGITVGIWAAPLLPYITDTNESIEQVVKAAKENGAQFVLGVSTDTRNSNRFKAFLAKNYPHLVPKYERLYDWKQKPQNYYPNEAYLYDLYKRFITICQKYNVEHYIPHFHTRRQAWLFYLRNLTKFKGTPTFELTQLINYLSPTKELLQAVRIRNNKNNSLTNSFLKTFGYFPH